ncbi:MAG: protein kinase [Labilithrix sp.]|nr:protein kinase [Labilithrix sp.]
MTAAADETGQVIGRYVIYDEIAAGGMASVHLGRLKGAVGFSRTVAIKRLHPHLARDEEFSGMFLDEARLAARIRHPNVVAVLDVVHDGSELFLVMDYVQGESLSRLARAMRPGAIPPRIAVTVMAGVLHGLHAAHEATTEHGEPLNIVHRDVSPQNVMVGTDGVARVFDFGVAKASHRSQATQDGSVKGKISYMAPEQLLSEPVDRRADVYAAAVVLWEALTGERLFDGENQGRIVRMILDEPVPPPSKIVVGLPKALDEAVMRGLDRDVSRRWQSAREFAGALERCLPAAPATEVGEWVESLGGVALGARARRVKDIESRSDIFSATGPASAPEPKEATAETVLEPKIGPPTVPQAFAVMATEPADLRIVPSKPPDEPSRAPSSRGIAAAPISKPEGAPSSAKIMIKTPLAALSVQTVAVTPLASLQEAAAARRSGGRKVLVLGIALAVLGVLAVAFAVTWTLLHR